MPAPIYEPTPPDPRAALRAALEIDSISSEIAALRLAVLRADVPETVVQIDVPRADDTAIAVKATIGRGGGGRATAIAALDVDPDRSWADQLAEAEAIAVARALDQLGMTTERALQSGRASSLRPAPGPSASPVPPAASDQPTPQKTAPVHANPGEDDLMPEFSWNAFWQHARTAGITREQVEQAMGRSVKEATPQQAVEALKANGQWQG